MNKYAEKEWSEYQNLDAIGLSRLVRSGILTPSDTTRIATEILESLSDLNATVEIYDDKPIGSASGLLAGVPIIRKDLDGEEKGRLTEWCSPLASGTLSNRDSVFFEKLKNAGAIVVGRSTTPELGSAITTESRMHGATANPWDISRNSGGSSGGSAALVASGAVPIAHGSDAAGSLRIPAAWCGICTLKPARGRISQAPDGPNLFGLSENFVLSRSIRDLRLIYRILEQSVCGEFYDFRESQSSRLGRQNLSIGYLENRLGDSPVDDEYHNCVLKLAREYQSCGFNVIPINVEFNFDRYVEFILTRFSYSLSWHANSLGSRHDSSIWQRIHPTVLAWKEYGESLPRNAIFDAIGMQNLICREVGGWFKNIDVLITPVTACLPPIHGKMVYDNICSNDIPSLNRKYEDHIQFCGPTNVSGHPSLVFPFGMHSTGTPIGVQLIGQFNSTETLFDLAELVFSGISHTSFPSRQRAKK